MTTEEKAKAYDEALDRMRHVVVVPKDEKALQALKETIFPELRESEDERIRKEIINYLDFAESHNLLRAADYEKKKGWIDWLEKQKDAFENGRQFGIMQEQGRQELEWTDEKQKEQKLIQTDAEKEYVRTLKSLVADFVRANNYIERGYYQQIYDWLDGRHVEVKEQKPADFPSTDEEVKEFLETHPKVEVPEKYKTPDFVFSKQDYSGLNDLERAIHRGFLSAGVENVPVTIIKETANECKRTQTIANENANAEWSEEDKKIIQSLILGVNKYVFFAGIEVNKIVSFLKSLLQQPHWKPSEEQKEPEYYQHFDPDC